MPMPDPFENVMTMLRNKGSVDPNTSAARSASIKDQRRTVGATPPAQRKPPQSGGSRTSMPQEGQMGEQMQPDMMTPVVKSLNEAILGLKAQIHRTTDQEQRRMLEQQAQQIRQRVVDMGGEPIWADESIEEGMRKLQAMGAPQQEMPQQGGMPPFVPQAQQQFEGGGVPDWVQGAQDQVGGGRPDWTMLDFNNQPQEQPQEQVIPQEGEEDHLGPWLKRRMMKERVKAMRQQRQGDEE